MFLAVTSVRMSARGITALPFPQSRNSSQEFFLCSRKTHPEHLHGLRRIHFSFLGSKGFWNSARRIFASSFAEVPSNGPSGAACCATPASRLAIPGSLGAARFLLESAILRRG